MKFRLSLLIMSIICLSCVAQEQLKDYYYHFSKQKETKVYKYVDKNDSTKVEYWKVTSLPETNELKTVSYTANFRVYNTFDEKITQDGALLTAYSDFEPTNEGEQLEIKAKVIDRGVYMWNGEKEYNYLVHYKNQYGRFEFKKKRTAIGMEVISVNGKQYKAAKFRDDYFIYALDQNAVQLFHQDCYYVKNIGMIKYERKIPVQHELIELELKEILTEADFEKLIANK